MPEEALFHGKIASIMRSSFTRLFQTSSVTWDNPAPSTSDSKKVGSEVSQVKQKPAPPPSGADGRLPSSPRGSPTALDKKFLVWSGQYKSADEIPRTLEGEVIHRARSWGRIRMNILFLFLVAGMGGTMVYSEKKGASRGESLEQQNLEWHRKINEEHKQKKGQK